MVDNSTSAINCFCKSCILTEVKKLEQRKLYNEVSLIFHDAVHYYSQITKELEEEKERFILRMNQSNQAQFAGIQSFRSPTKGVMKQGGPAGCTNIVCHKQIYYRRFPEKSKADGEFTFPVAVFENEPDPCQIPMYPKHLVYKDGKDIQLEEIRASMYWEQVKKKDDQISNRIKPVDKKAVESSPLIDVNETPSHKTNTCNAETAYTPCSKETRKPLQQLRSNENSSTPLAESKVIDVELNNATLADEKLISICKNPHENVAISILKCKNLKETSSCVKESREKPERILPGIEPLILVSPENPADREPQKNDKKLQESKIPCMTTKTTVTYSPNRPFAAENQTAPKIQQIERQKLQSTKIIARVDPMTKTKNLSPNLATAERDGRKFTDATFVCNPIQKTSATLQKTYVIDGESHSNNSEHTSQKEAGTLEKTPKQLPYLDELSKLLEELNTNSNIAKEQHSVQVHSVNNEEKENYLPINLIPPPWEEDEEDNTCNTKAFAIILPSSTPNRRRSQFYSNGPFNEPKNSIDRPRQSMASTTMLNLSMIPETSRERSTSSSGAGSVTSAVNSKNFVQDKPSLSAIVEIEEKSNTTRTNYDILDPFDSELLDSLLRRMEFPCERHLPGYNQMNSDMPNMNKSTSNVKLGSEKYTIAGEIGKGNYARILKAHSTGKPAELVALKLQKPACVWEYYISKEIRHKLKTEEKCKYFLDYSNIFVFRNGSVLVSEWAPFGSLLNFRNVLKTSGCGSEKFPMAVSLHLSIQIISAIEYLHSCQIIHGDVKPDNFIVGNISNDGKPSVKLIDFGRSINMALFPAKTVFRKIVKTEDFTCNEMRDGKPWTYQTDLFGMAGTFYVLLNGEYMKTVKRNDGVWMLKKPLPRYMFRDQWDPIFTTLLNIPSCKELPDLSMLKQQLNIFYNSFSHSEKKQQFSKILPLFKK